MKIINTFIVDHLEFHEFCCCCVLYSYHSIISMYNIGEAKVKGGSAGVHLTMAREGRPSGEAYVEMESEDDLKAALKKDREHMGNRYIEGDILLFT